jgi:O-antigen biosynthesis protein
MASFGIWEFRTTSSRRIDRALWSDDRPALHDALRAGRFSPVTALRRAATRSDWVTALLERALRHFPALEEALRQFVRGDALKRYERWIDEYDTLSETDLLAMRRIVSGNAPHVFSVLVPLAGSSAKDVAVLTDSLIEQVHEGWQAHLVANDVLAPPLSELVAELPARDTRFKGMVRWDDVSRLTATEYFVVARPTVSLRPHALLLMASAIERDPSVDLIYGDDDAVGSAGARRDHSFKPDWNETLLRCQNYIGDLVCLRRPLAAAARCDDVLDASCWGLLLRLAERVSPATVRHIPHVLSHRQTSRNGHENGRKDAAAALARRLRERGDAAEIELAGSASYRVRYALPAEAPLVTVIVPTTGKLDVLRPCVEGVLNRTDYAHIDLLVVVTEHGERTREQAAYLEEVAKSPRASILFTERGLFNFSSTNNFAAARAAGGLLCFLNDDTEVFDEGWLAAMTGHVLRERVGAVGAKLFYPNGRIQHAGVILGAGGVAAHSYRGMRSDNVGYHDRAVVDQEVSCVTAACMLVRREAFVEVGGFDEALTVAFNDVDLCLRLRRAGWRVVWTPSAQLCHKESVSTGAHYVAERQTQWASEWNLVRSRWATELTKDPFYSPNLSLDPWELWEPAFPPRVSYPWRDG